MAPIHPNEALKLAQQALTQAQETKRNNEAFLRSIGPAIIDALRPVLNEVRNAVASIKVDVKPQVTVNPKVDMPTFNIPEIKVPTINVPEPKVTVNIPAIKVPDIIMPESMDIRGWVSLMGYDKGFLSNPLPVQIRDAKGNPIDFSSIGGGTVVEGGSSGGGNFPMATYDAATSAIRITGTVTASSSASQAVVLVNTEGVAYNSDNAQPVSIPATVTIAQVSGAVFSVNVVSDSIALDQSTDSVLAYQVSGSAYSVNVVGPIAQGDSATAVRVVIAGNSDASVVVNSGTLTGITNTITVDQLSGATWSVFATNPVNQGDVATALRVVVAGNSDMSVVVNNPQGQGDLATALRVVIAGNSDASVVVNSGTLTGITNTITEQQLSGATDSVNIVTFNGNAPSTGLNETNSGVLRVVQMTDSNSSVNITTFNGNAPATGLNETTAGVLRVVHMTDSVVSVNIVSGSSSGAVGQGDAASATRVVIAGNSDASVSVNSWNGNTIATGLNETNAGVLRVVLMTDSVSSVYVNNPVNQGDAATALRVVIAGNSDASVVVNSGTLTGITNTVTQVQLSGAADSVNILTFNGNTPATGLNETTSGVLRVVQMTDSVSSVSVTNTVTVTGALSSSVTVLTRQTNPTAVAADYVPASADDLGRQLTRPFQVRDLIKTAYVTLTTGTEATLLAGVAGAYLDLMYIMGANNSDAAVQVDIRPVTAGNIVASLYIPAQATAGVSLPIPFPQTDTGNNWTADMADVTGTTVALSALFSQEV